MGWAFAIIGVGLGVLIGVITGVIFIYMIKSLSNAVTWLDGVKIVGEMLTVPTFWFGGPWAATKLLTHVPWDVVLPWYIVFLTTLFFGIAWRPLIKFIVRTAKETEGLSGPQQS